MLFRLALLSLCLIWSGSAIAETPDCDAPTLKPLEDIKCTYILGEHASDELYYAEYSRALRKPSTKSVLIVKEGNEWRIKSKGFYRLSRHQGASTVTLQYDGDLESVRELKKAWSPERMLAATRIDRYGYDPKDQTTDRVICSDGSSLTVLRYDGQDVIQADRHSCAGRTDIDALAEELIAIAVREDRQMKTHLKDFTIKD